MSKWRERVNKILDAETERLKQKYRDAEGNWHDTGYQRYYSQMEKIEAELDDIDTMRNGKIELQRALDESLRLRQAIGEYQKQLEEYKMYHKGVERPIEETVDQLKIKLAIVLGNARPYSQRK